MKMPKGFNKWTLCQQEDYFRGKKKLVRPLTCVFGLQTKPCAQLDLWAGLFYSRHKQKDRYAKAKRQPKALAS